MLTWMKYFENMYNTPDVKRSRIEILPNNENIENEIIVEEDQATTQKLKNLKKSWRR